MKRTQSSFKSQTSIHNHTRTINSRSRKMKHCFTSGARWRFKQETAQESFKNLKMKKRSKNDRGLQKRRKPPPNEILVSLLRKLRDLCLINSPCHPVISIGESIEDTIIVYQLFYLFTLISTIIRLLADVMLGLM